MQLSPATLSTIVAVLSAQDVVATHSQIAAALAVLTGEPDNDANLRPGEIVVVYDNDRNELEEYGSLEKASNAISDSTSCKYDGYVEDYVQVFIVRRALTVTSSRAIKFS